MASSALSAYHCTNENMDFTGGITAQQKFLLTGTPEDLLDEGKDYGEGFCPNCGKDCVSTKKDYEALKPGSDPNEAHHLAVHAMVVDPNNDKVTGDNAQAVLLERIGGGK